MKGNRGSIPEKYEDRFSGRMVIFIVIFGIAVMAAFLFQILDSENREGAAFSKAEGTLGCSVERNKKIELLTHGESGVEAFSVQTLDRRTMKKMMGKSYKPNENIKLSDLQLVKVVYLGFDNRPHKGEIIVNKRVSKEVALIFQELYKAKFQIEKIELIDEYGGDDEKSMASNNTTGFNYRKITGGKSLSNHGLGLAIDINPRRNPYVNGKRVLPMNSRSYLDRKNLRKGMITQESTCYKIFRAHGWSWGGDWKKPKDYQHFEKVMNEH